MTQGEEQRHGATAGEFQRNLELSHRSDTNSSLALTGTANIQSVAEMLLPPCLHRPTTNPPAHGGEDAKNLLQFVHHASCDIKAALDQGNYTRKPFRQHSAGSERPEHNGSDRLKKDHSPVRRFSADGMLSQHLQRHSHHPHHHHHPPPPHHPRHHHPLGRDRDRLTNEDIPPETDDVPPRSSRDMFMKRHELAFPFADQEIEHSNHNDNGPLGMAGKDIDEDKQRANTQERGENLKSRSKSDNDSMDLFSYVDLLRENSLKQANDDDQSESESNNESEPVSIRASLPEKKVTSMEENDKSNKVNTVPLRKRRLPASFWQEPKGKSENHRIITRPVDGHSHDGQPRSFVHHPGLSLFGQLKLPVPSPLSPGHLDFDFGLGRHFCGDKNPFVYPSTSTTSPFLNLNLPYRPHLPIGVPHNIDDRHRHGLHVPCGNNVCMCHLQNLAAYSSTVCEPSSQSASGLFGRSPTIPTVSPLDNTPSSALALNRWGAMQSIDTAAEILGGYPMPRVLKPIPTKSLTSYPPRFHPIFT